MAGFSPTGGGERSSSPASSFVITEVAFPAADTEFTHVIDSTTKRFEISTQGIKRFQIGHVTAATDVWKNKSGRIFRSGQIELTAGLTLYFESPDTGDTLQIIEWRG